MKVSWLRIAPRDVVADWIVIGVWDADAGLWPTPAARDIDEATGGLLTRLRRDGDFSGKSAELLPLAGLAGVRAERVLVVGLGKPSAVGLGTWFTAGATAARHIVQKKRSRVAFALDHDDAAGAVRRTSAVVEGAIVGSRGQDLLKSEPKLHAFDELVHVAAGKATDDDLNLGTRRGRIVGSAVNLTRDLVNGPPQLIYPASFAERAQAVAASAGVRCEVFDEERIGRERMGGLAGVAAGSARPPRFVVLEYEGTSNRGAPRLAIVGKGITFDSGGLSLKTSEQMEHMKGDMAGAATMLAAVSAIAQLRLPVRVLGLAALAENMPGPLAMKLGDVLTARNGKTMEILNTDAEGRLVLSDALCYAVDQGASHIVDLATLTGSCVIALGAKVAGLMTNDAAWADRVKTAAARVGERLWELPMFDDYAEQIQSGVADIKNIGGKYGGAITAAKFLENFVAGVPWVHLDIAGPAWADKASATQDAGGTGALVRTLVELAENYKETK
jgi:leucyl aminopeptidase